MSKEHALKNDQIFTFLEYKNQELWYQTTMGSTYPEPLHQRGDAGYLSLEWALQLQR
jgi:hypothetical protein